MANFVLIENNEIKEKHDLLPKTWKNVSGLHLAKDDEEFLNSLGWYTVNKIQLPYIEGQQYIDGYEYKFENNLVYEIPVIKNAEIYPPEPEKTPEDLFNIAISELRVKRDQLLTECDWTQLVDVQSKYSTQWKTNWSMYRQELRDLPNRCISGEINIYSFEWPVKPQAADILLVEETNSTPTDEPVVESTEETIVDDTTQNPNVGE